jgi:hypothetical protein
MTCPVCNGNDDQCPHCEGTGVACEICEGAGFHFNSPEQDTCDDCGGSGRP